MRWQGTTHTSNFNPCPGLPYFLMQQTVAIWGWFVLWGGEVLGTWVLNGLPGLYPLDASGNRPTTVVTPINVSRHCQVSQREGRKHSP